MNSLRRRSTDLPARGEPFQWLLGGALALGMTMIVGLLLLVLWNGLTAFWPRSIALVTLADGSVLAGEEVRRELFRPSDAVVQAGGEAARRARDSGDGYLQRRLFRVGNFDLYREDFRWVSDFEVAARTYPDDLMLFERLEWGPFIGQVEALLLQGAEVAPDRATLQRAHSDARERLRILRRIERDQLGSLNHQMESDRLALRRAELRHGAGSSQLARVEAEIEARRSQAEARFAELLAEARAIRDADAANRVRLREVGGTTVDMPVSQLVRFYPANELGFGGKLAVYLSRWKEFLTEDPREANTEGGVFPAIFGTVVMTILMALIVAPFGVVTALYLREYARQGRFVSLVRISVNNLAGVPSIVYGVFGLGFFAYFMGVGIDQLFYAERLPNPTFGTGGILWASLTLALLTVPVVIVATEEALAAVPRSMREGALACGASKWQTIRHIVLPRAMPGVMTGLILAMARGAGEVAPLMLIGVVKLAPELPIDGNFPFIHLERSFMHLGFHIFDVGFQSRNSEAGKPMVFVTTLLLIGLVFLINISAIYVRNRLKRRFQGSRF
jgi:phosphate transport system permease protein